MVSKEVQPMGTLPTIIPISDLRQDTAGVIKRVVATDEPVVITQRGRATAVLVSAEAYERTQHENELLRVLARGDAEIAAGLGRDAEDVMAEARALLAEK
jgi:prevent-host-death family protein